MNATKPPPFIEQPRSILGNVPCASDALPSPRVHWQVLTARAGLAARRDPALVKHHARLGNVVLVVARGRRAWVGPRRPWWLLVAVAVEAQCPQHLQLGSLAISSELMEKTNAIVLAQRTRRCHFFESETVRAATLLLFSFYSRATVSANCTISCFRFRRGGMHVLMSMLARWALSDGTDKGQPFMTAHSKTSV